MANAARLADLDAERTAAVRQALTELLAGVPGVEAAYARFDGPYVRVRAVVREHEPAVTDALSNVQGALFERFPGLRFDLSATAHQGRRSSLDVARGEEPVYARAT